MPIFASPTEKTLLMPVAAWLLLAACLGALGFVYIMQYGYGVQPCILCMWQRLPYALGAAAAISALLWRPYDRRSALPLLIYTACMLGGFALAVFHTGVELHWWLGTASCSVHPLTGGSPDDLRAALLTTVSARCDEIAWTWLGLSMANWNILASLILSVFSTAAGVKAAAD